MLKELVVLDGVHLQLLPIILEHLSKSESTRQREVLELLPMCALSSCQYMSKRFILVTFPALMGTERWPGYSQILSKHVNNCLEKYGKFFIEREKTHLGQDIAKVIDQTEEVYVVVKILGVILRTFPSISSHFQLFLYRVLDLPKDVLTKQAYESFLKSQRDNAKEFIHNYEELLEMSSSMKANQPVPNNQSYLLFLQECQKTIASNGYLPLDAGTNLVTSMTILVEKAPNVINCVPYRLTSILEQELILPKAETVRLLSMLAERHNLLNTLSSVFDVLFDKLEWPGKATVTQNLCELYSRNQESSALNRRIVHAFKPEYKASNRKVMDSIALNFFNATASESEFLPDIYWDVIESMLIHASSRIVDHFYRKLVSGKVNIESDFLNRLLLARPPSSE